MDTVNDGINIFGFSYFSTSFLETYSIESALMLLPLKAVLYA